LAKLVLKPEVLEAAVLGGSYFGGGGGGSAQGGLLIGNLALTIGDPVLLDIEDLPEDAVLVTTSGVGAPAAKGKYVKPYHYLRSVELFRKYSGIQIDGFVTNECGGAATVNGWLQAAAFGLPVVDAPCNGRAHPTGIMGSAGLHAVPGYISAQMAVGGNPDANTYVEVYARGSLDKASSMVRQAAVQAGGSVIVTRNPANAGYLKNHGAVGAIKRCIEVGQAMTAAQQSGSSEDVISAAAHASGGEIAFFDKVADKNLKTAGGFDVGTVMTGDGFEITFWNEYMTLEKDSRRLATFPDLIVTLDQNSGLPLSSAELVVGQEIAVVTVPRDRLILGAGMKDGALFKAAEQAIGKDIITFL